MAATRPGPPVTCEIQRGCHEARLQHRQLAVPEPAVTGPAVHEDDGAVASTAYPEVDGNTVSGLGECGHAGGSYGEAEGPPRNGGLGLSRSSRRTGVACDPAARL